MSPNVNTMLRSLVTKAWNNLMKDKASSVINILGLTIGITCCLFLFIYILDELSYDRYHKDAENIYRVVSNIKEPDNEYTWAVAQIPLGEELQEFYPEVKNAVRFFSTGPTQFRIANHSYTEDEFYLADSSVFDMFSYEFMKGDPSQSLAKPYSVVLTETIARKYFGTPANAMYKFLENSQGENFLVTGVMKDVPSNSHFRFDALISRNTRPDLKGGWGNFGVLTYVQLADDCDLGKVIRNLDALIKQKVQPLFNEFNMSISYKLQRITDIHGQSGLADNAVASDKYIILYVFGGIGVSFLVFVLFNYLKLANVRSSMLSKEAALQKSFNAKLPLLLLEFFTESLVIAIIAMTLSVILTTALLPVFNNLTHKELEIFHLFKTPVLAALGTIVLLSGIIGCSYPALYLTGIRERLRNKGNESLFPKDILVKQF